MHPDEDRPPPRRAGAGVLQILDDRLPDIVWERELVDPVARAAHGDLTAAPVDIVEAQRRDLTGPQPESDQQRQDREVPGPVDVARSQQVSNTVT